MDDLIRILADWNQWWESGKVSPELVGTERDCTRHLMDLLPTREVKVLTGVRRSGKSTLFYQLIHWLITEKRVAPRQVMLVNFEDAALSRFSLDDIFNTYLTHLEPEGRIYLFLDEVHQKDGWEQWIRKKYDLKHAVDYFVTGSSAGLLAGEYATLLTGRNITTTIYPLGFKELLEFSGIRFKDIRLVSQETRSRIDRLLLDYLSHGGFPEMVFHRPELKRRLLNQYFLDILYKDIVARQGGNPSKLKELAVYLMTNVSNLISARALRGTFGFGLTMIGDYLGFLEDAFLLFQLYFFDYSLKRQAVNPRKIYAVDNGLRNAVAFKFSQDMGRLMENAVFMELRHRDMEAYYWKDRNKREVDFLVRQGNEVRSAIQVCADPEDEQTHRREIAALESAMDAFDLDRGLILTLQHRRTIKAKNGQIDSIPLSEWLLT